MIADQIKPLIDTLVTGGNDATAIGRLAELCIAMANTIVASRFRRIMFTAARAGYHAEDVAVLSVESLFDTRGGVACAELRRYFEADDLYKAPAAEILIGLRKLLYRKVAQTVAEVAGETDPHYRKILRNVRDAARMEPGWRTVQLFNDTVLILTRIADPLLHLHGMPEDEMLAELSRRARPSESIKQLVTHLLEIAAEQDACRKACSLYSICSVIREYFLHLRWTAEYAADAEIPVEASVAWPSCVDAAVERLREGLLRQYRERDVFDAAYAALCERAARRMLEDLPLEGARRFFEYFREQFPDTTYEQYRANGRARFEYIMHCAKEQFFAVCREGIGE